MEEGESSPFPPCCSGKDGCSGIHSGGPYQPPHGRRRVRKLHGARHQQRQPERLLAQADATGGAGGDGPQREEVE
eukprot:scaffold5493_cov125-Isochrysis_galbana.AAC.3